MEDKKKINIVWRCGYCRLPYETSEKAEKCKESHDIVYVGLSRSDLNRLVNFIYTGEEQLITDSLLDNLKKYLRLDINKKG